MKWVVRILVVLVVLIGGFIGSSYWWLDGAARQLIEEQGSDALGVTLTLEKLSIGVLKGTAVLGNLNIANPPGCEKPFFFDLGEGSTEVNLKSVMDDEIHIPSVELSGLTMYIEPVKGGGGKYNYDVLLEHIEKYTKTDEAKPKDESEKTVVIKKLVIKDIKVYYKTKMFIQAPVHVAEIVMNDLGSDGRGVDMGELISIILSGTLSGIANELPGAIGDGIKTGLKGLGDIGGVAVGALGDVGKGTLDAAGKGIEKGTEDVKKGIEKLNPFGKK